MSEQPFDVEDGEITSEEEVAPNESTTTPKRTTKKETQKAPVGDKKDSEAGVPAAAESVPEPEDDMARSIREYINERKKMHQVRSGYAGQPSGKKRKADVEGTTSRRPKRRKNCQKEDVAPKAEKFAEADKGAAGNDEAGTAATEKPSMRDVCKYFLKGFCRKTDGCTFSHDLSPFRRDELCRFYLSTGGCRKRESCLYMHEEFPCKYFHTGAPCYAGKKCRFSHEALTDASEIALNKWLDVSSSKNPDGICVMAIRTDKNSEEDEVPLPKVFLEEKLQEVRFEVKRKPVRESNIKDEDVDEIITPKGQYETVEDIALSWMRAASRCKQFAGKDKPLYSGMKKSDDDVDA